MHTKNSISEGVIALLPMKHHSERVPGKNYRLFNEKPLFHHILETLLEVNSIHKIIINTDSDTIQDMILGFNSKKIVINLRPDNLCGDFVPMNDIINYDINSCPENKHFIQTHSTNPLLKSKTLEGAINTYFEKLKEGYDSIFSVTKIQARLYDKNLAPINHISGQLLRTQDLPPVYEENSNFYIFSRESFLNNKYNRIGQKPFIYETSKLEAIDIDNEEDFELAEAVHKKNINTSYLSK